MKAPEYELKLIELETRSAYQEDMVAALNTTVSKQQVQLARLEKSLNLLAERLKGAAESDVHNEYTAGDEKPPHY